MFKVNNNDTRTTPVASGVVLMSLLLNFPFCSVNFEHVVNCCKLQVVCKSQLCNSIKLCNDSGSKEHIPQILTTGAVYRFGVDYAMNPITENVLDTLLQRRVYTNLYINRLHISLYIGSVYILIYILRYNTFFYCAIRIYVRFTVFKSSSV